MKDRPDMGDIEPLRQDGVPFRPLVAFDFDGTLTRRDSFLAFLRWRAGRRAYALGMARLAGQGLAYAVHRDRERLKAAAVRVFLKGVARTDLEQAAQRFAGDHGRELLRPDALRAWRRWQ